MKKITSVLFLFYCFSVGWAQTVPPCTLEITDAETFARDWTVIDVNSDVSANTWPITMAMRCIRKIRVMPPMIG